VAVAGIDNERPRLPTTFRSNFHHQILDKFPTKSKSSVFNYFSW
jgi:hypothetical protein